MTYQPPSAELNAFNCPHCRAFARQRWYWLFAQLSRGGAPHSISKNSGGGAGIPNQTLADLTAQIQRLNLRVGISDSTTGNGHGLQNIHLSRCDHCDAVALWEGKSIIWPQAVTAPAPAVDMPDTLVPDYMEAASISEKSPRGAAAILRLLIQKLCNELLGHPEKNLNEAIQTLVDRGLPHEVQGALDIVRVIGNESVHPGQIDLNDSPETASKLFHLVNMIVEQTITRRKKIDELMVKLPTAAKDAIARRGGVSKPHP